MKICRHIPALILLILISMASSVMAQPGHKVDVKKPAPYDNRVLRAEKTTDGKLKPHKRFFQNLTTHYNYYFNASTKLNEILDRAKAVHKDDFSELLSFYNYSREVTKADSIQLDSIIYKSQTGLLMHDLRSDWTDEMYLLWGATYYLWDKLDSASMMFQFINYAFAEKEEDGYYIPVGTHREGQNALSIASREKTGIFGRTTSRNNAFIWQIRTLTDLRLYSQAASLINTLKTDPFFPVRLTPALEEMQAYWYYTQKVWDSSAAHLIIAVDGAGTRYERARWEYLAAQMLEKAGRIEQAKEMYGLAISHTPDPVMEVFGRLNLVRLNKGSDNYIDQNIAELLRMAKRDKYEDYRDIIYYMAAQMEMERNNLDAAKELLIKGTKSNNSNTASKNKAFLQIADLSYQQRKYHDAASFYDSLQVHLLADEDRDRVNERKPILSKIVSNDNTIERQDSLQLIAVMPEAERQALLTKMVKQMRKQQGLKDEPVTYGRTGNSQPAAPDLFSSASKGEWYFYNTSSKTQGQQQFRQVWGNRPNTDNWRRSGNVAQQLQAQNQLQGAGNSADVPAEKTLTVETLSANLPLTAEGMKKSNDSIKGSLFTLGAVYLNEAEDYLSAIDALEALRRRFPDFEKMDEVLFNLYYAYLRAGDLAKAAQIKSLLQNQYASSAFASKVNNTKPAGPAGLTPQATKDYEQVYNLFIEGAFEQAKAEKRRADSIYQTNYWQPQLLYIESVYYIRQREDSLAKDLLGILIAQEGSNGMGRKAANLLDVLSRRAEIERELAAYQIQNQPEAYAQPVAQVPVKTEVPATPPPAVAPPVTAPPVAAIPVQKDSISAAPEVAVMPRKDTVAVTEVPKNPPVTVAELPKADTVATVAVAPPPAVPQKDTPAVAIAEPKKEVIIPKEEPRVIPPPVETVKSETVVQKPVSKPDSVVVKPPTETVVKTPVSTAPSKPAVVIDPNQYHFDPGMPHYAVVVLDKVDPIFVSEARNAFARFSKEKFSTLPLEAQINDITAETRLVLISGFTSAQGAINYVQEAKRLAVSEIVPWLKADKYTFSIISSRNLELLKKKAQWSDYKKFTDENFPVKF